MSKIITHLEPRASHADKYSNPPEKLNSAFVFLLAPWVTMVAISVAIFAYTITNPATQIFFFLPVILIMGAVVKIKNVVDETRKEQDKVYNEALNRYFKNNFYEPLQKYVESTGYTPDATQWYNHPENAYFFDRDLNEVFSKAFFNHKYGVKNPFPTVLHFAVDLDETRNKKFFEVDVRFNTPRIAMFEAKVTEIVKEKEPLHI